MVQALMLVLSLIVAQPSTGPSKDDSAPTKEQITESIERFMAKPAAGEDAQRILDFAEESEDVLIALDEKLLPWMAEDKNYKQAQVLMVAFVAGNIKSQLASGKAVDDGYAGLLAVFKAYETLKQTDKDLKIPEIEEFMAKEKKGELKKFVEDAGKSRGK